MNPEVMKAIVENKLDQQITRLESLGELSNTEEIMVDAAFYGISAHAVILLNIILEEIERNRKYANR